MPWHAMRLPDFIRHHIEPILDQWEQFAKAFPHADKMDPVALRDHARGILNAIALDLEQAQTAHQQAEKSKGRGPQSQVATEAELHGLSRFAEGFDVNESIAEFRALRASVLRLAAPNLVRPAIAADDITRFNEAVDQAVAESLARFTALKERRNRLFEALLSTSPDLYYIVETSGALTYANKAFADLFRKTCGELAGADFYALCAPYVRDIDRQVRNVVTSGTTYRGEMEATLESGEKRTFEYLLVPVINPAGFCEAVAGSARDITARKESEERVRRSANHDFLTDLPNRSLFRERLEHELKHAARTGLPLALLFIDLDLFKEVNDSLGHAAGDQMLQEVAHRINACVRETDTVARLGGDEFTVILTDVTRPEHIENIAAEILEELRKPFALDAGEARISCSIGITVYPGHGASPDELVRNADEAMYASKNAGRNQYQIFTHAMRAPSAPDAVP
jgi:diguanylate cyclase (GGDEF)-like protein/PAS domain S-box-containing protein